MARRREVRADALEGAGSGVNAAETTASADAADEESSPAGADKVTEIRSLADFKDEKWNEGRILYDEKYYRYRDGLQNYLFMGIDNDGKAEQAPDGISGGQSDAMFLLILDEVSGEISVLLINRNTMAPVDVYDEEGNYLLQMDLQICLQHGYGDGMKLSCMRTVEAVQRLLGNVGIDGYLALNVGGVPEVNDALGGVEITPIESVKRGDVVIKKGEPVTLTGEQAYVYLRARDVDEFGSADLRLKRQEQYITAAAKKVLKDPSLAGKIYDAGSDYIVASIDLPKLADAAGSMELTEDRIYEIPGTTVFKDEYEQYETDEDEFIKLLIDVFYEEEE